ncbi:MAG: protein kinase [Holophagaceae bacterium]
MTLQPGTRLGPYEVLSPLGAGGMGEVWKAKDARLDRFVAIKVLPEHLTANADALGRFEREAKAVAALNHPNILGLFDTGRQDGLVFAVMELLEGETLRARLAQGPLPPRKATELAIQMAKGLAAAHEKGVIHRDLKPENLWLTRDGRLKILDFGLAKQAAKPGPGSGSNSLLPTEALAAGAAPHQTEAGMILGTVGYMSPEQVRGEAVDARSDLFSFGVVLFEMLTGKKAFARDTTSDTLAAILRDDPPELEASGRAVPPGLQRILQHCLEKDPGQRFHDAEDLAFALSNLGSGTDSAAPFTAPFAPPNRRATRLWAGLVALAVLGAGVAGWVLRGGPPPTPVVTLRPVTHSGHDTSPAASPDGQTLAFTSDREGRPRIWLKQLKGGAERVLTEGPDDFPRFSPDGSSVLFVRAAGRTGTLYRTFVMGGEPRKVAEDVVQGDWSPDGQQIALVRLRIEKDRTDSLVVLLPAAGGAERVLATFPGESIGNPRWSPDGRRIALNTFSAATTGGQLRKVFVVEVEGGRFQELKPPLGSGTLSSAVWAGNEELIYMQSESVAGNGVAVSSCQAVRQNIRTQAIQRLFWAPNNGNTLDLLPDGRILYDCLTGRQNLREWDLAGKAAPRWLTRGSINDRQPVFSRDGEWVTFSSNRSGNLDLWAVSTRSGVVRSITDDPAEDWDPGLTPDGKSLLWSSNRMGVFEIWASNPDGTGARQVSRDGEDAENPTQTPDGRWIVYASGNRRTPGIWKVHPDGSGTQLLVPGAAALLPEVSPDGVWALYLTAEGTRSTLQAVRIEDGKDAGVSISQETKRKSVVTVGRSRWMPDGRRIVFTGQDERGLDGVYVQDFVPGKDTTATRRRLAGFDPDWKTESLGLSPDGKRLVLSETENLFSILVADGVPGLARKGKTR